MVESECKYCSELCKECDCEGLECIECNKFVHVKCLKRGATPGGFVGDIFFQFTCFECSANDCELYIRNKMPWLQAILLTLYHMQKRCSGVAKKGYFHWKVHIANFISEQWNVLFRKDFKRKKNWIGTISGTLSHYSPLFFKSGTEVFNEQGWWALSLPTLTPNCVVKLNAEMVAEKQRRKDVQLIINEPEMLKELLRSKPYFSEELLSITEVAESKETHLQEPKILEIQPSIIKKEKKKTLLPGIVSRYNFKEASTSKANVPVVDLQPRKRSKNQPPLIEAKHLKVETISDIAMERRNTSVLYKVADPALHFNTAIEDNTPKSKLTLKERLAGDLQSDLIFTSYSQRYICPYIYRFSEMNPPWLQLMDNIKVAVNKNDDSWKLPPRGSIDFVRVQASHIPAINSLCNQFFWPGIDVSNVLEYPEFSCVVLYRKLVVAFALLTPDVNINESYLSFIFTRPNWRNIGIGKIMLYSLIKANTGRDLTLHVSKNSKALLLYNKFCFKIEHIVQGFYDKYMRNDTSECKDAYFCRLAR